jgi:predicted DCC family thiol-disulfide oxidoreductase YuxK
MARDVCYYDGWCGMCRRSTRILRALDWFGRLEFRDMTAEPDLPVGLDAAMAGMPMKTRSGRALVGFPAVRRAAAQTALAPLAVLLYVPGIAPLSARVYRRIASGRRRACPDPRAPGFHRPPSRGILPP